MSNIGKWGQAMTLSLALGLVDQINNGIALIEYDIGGGPEHLELKLEGSACVPKEGEWVLFNQEGIMHCGVERHRDVGGR